MLEYYDVFYRTWWKREGEKLVPSPGPKHYLARKVSSFEAARELAQAWNRVHEPGILSRKAEFERS